MKQFLQPTAKYITFIYTLFSLLTYQAHSQIITTIAGNGSGIYNGDNMPATQAQFLPTSITIDRIGNLFISDLDGSRVRKIDGNGIITTVAGNGVRDFNGDGALAINASLNYNWGIALDSALNLYIVDDGESRVRKVTTDGIINTIAGIDTVNGGGYNGDNILAINARFEHPACIALDTIGNIYISDQGRRIRKIDANGIITTIAGTGVSGYSGDGGLAVNARIGDSYEIVADKKGNIYFTDGENYVVRKVDKNGIITTVAGNGSVGYTGDGGPANLAALYPAGLAVDKDGILYIADGGNHVIRKVDEMGIITTFIGDGSPGFSGDGGFAKNAKLNLPADLAFDIQGNLLIADYGNARIRRVTPAVLPVTLTTFTAINDNNKVKINWQTASEINSAYFNVLKSNAGNSFTTIGKVEASGNSSITHTYQFIDEQTNNLVNIMYYRLQSVDKDGNSNFSKIVAIKNNGLSKLLQIFPNPAKNILNVQLTDVHGTLSLQVIDASGKKVKEEKIIVNQSASMPVNIHNLPKGTYTLLLKNDKVYKEMKFVKE